MDMNAREACVIELRTAGTSVLPPECQAMHRTIASPVTGYCRGIPFRDHSKWAERLHQSERALEKETRTSASVTPATRPRRP